MKILILLLFIGVPLAEIAVFIKVGEAIGIAATVVLVILTAVIGVALLKRQGLAALADAQKALDAGRVPVDAVTDGVCLLLAGAFLLTPGLITDVVGFLLLVPGFRRGLARWLFAKVRESGMFTVHTVGGPDFGPAPRRSTGDPSVIDGEYEVESESQSAGTHADEPSDEARPSADDGKSPWKK